MTKRLSTILLTFMLMMGTSGLISVYAVGSYGVNLANAAYQSNVNPFYASGYGGNSSDGSGGECTWYAWGRAYEKLGVALPCRGNANNWTSEAANAGYATGTDARANSIMVEHYAGTGHVFFVEKVENGYAYVTEGNWLGHYHEDAINLTTMRRESWKSQAMGSIDYIYLSSNPTVSFSSWENSKYTYIGSTDASLGQEITVSGGSCTETGMYLYNSGETFLAEAHNPSYTNPKVFFKINEECGYTLSPGTTYKYKFYAIVDGKYYWSNFYTFNSIPKGVSFSSWENGNYTYIRDTDASIGQEINVSGGTCTATGMYLYDSDGNHIATAHQNNYYYRIYFKINEECGYTLTHGTTYKYKFYAVVDGKTYWGNEGSFTTTGSHTWDNGRITKAVTCETAGVKTYTCSGCGSTRTEIIPSTGHKLTYVPAKAATTSEDGNIEYWICSSCGKIFNDSTGKTEIAKASTVIDRLPGNGSADANGTSSAIADSVNLQKDLPAAKISKPKAAKKKITVKWKKVSKKNQKKIQGIEIQVATDPAFTNIVKTATASRKKTSKKISGLLSKTRYYVRIRAYKNASDGKHVSAWKMKSVKVK